jgi:hypothetical protein
VEIPGDLPQNGSSKTWLLRTESMKAKLRAKNDVRGRPSNTVAGTVKIKIYACGSSGRSAGLGGPVRLAPAREPQRSRRQLLPGNPLRHRGTPAQESLGRTNCPRAGASKGTKGAGNGCGQNSPVPGLDSGELSFTVGTLEFRRWRRWPVRREIVPPRRPLQDDDDKEGPCQRRP